MEVMNTVVVGAINVASFCVALIAVAATCRAVAWFFLRTAKDRREGAREPAARQL